MARVTQQPESNAEVRAIGMCTRAATVKLVRSIRTEAYACQEGQKDHASSDGQDPHDCFRSCASVSLHKYLMSTVKREEIASETPVTLQDPDRRPAGKTVPGTVLARLETKTCQHSIDGQVNFLIAPCLTTGHSGPHKRPEEAQSRLLHPANRLTLPLLARSGLFADLRLQVGGLPKVHVRLLRQAACWNVCEVAPHHEARAHVTDVLVT